MIPVIDAIDVGPVRDPFKGLPENDGASQDTVRRRYGRALAEVCRNGNLVCASGKLGLLQAKNKLHA